MKHLACISGILKTSRLPSVDMQKKYSDYINFLYRIKSIPQKYVSDRYVPTMEDAMTLINSRVDGEMIQQVSQRSYIGVYIYLI